MCSLCHCILDSSIRAKEISAHHFSLQKIFLDFATILPPISYNAFKHGCFVVVVESFWVVANKAGLLLNKAGLLQNKAGLLQNKGGLLQNTPYLFENSGSISEYSFATTCRYSTTTKYTIQNQLFTFYGGRVVEKIKTLNI